MDLSVTSGQVNTDGVCQTCHILPHRVEANGIITGLLKTGGKQNVEVGSCE